MANPIPHHQQAPTAPHQEFHHSSSPDAMGFHFNKAQKRQKASNGARDHDRLSGEYRSTGGGGNEPNGSKAIPAGPHSQMQNGGQKHHGHTGGAGGAFEGARSPPGTKNTSHVPCKFFKVGACQAGAACPFSHSTDKSKFEAPCKYFSKGNCKFGAKCALLHVLPTGRIVNRANPPMSALNIGGRVDPMPYHPDSMQSGLGDLFMSQQPGGMNQPFGHQIPPMPEFEPGLPLHMHSQPFDIPQPNPRYSTQHEQGRGAALSPVTHLTTLDVPLPASFDSQEPSNIAKYGRIAASVPSKFGIDSPPHSLPKKSTIPADTLRNLHDSVFTREAQSKPQNLGTSPSGNFGGNFGQRPMFSSRIQKPKQLSCSLPEWEDEDMMFGGEEDYIPEALSHLLNDQERTRRNSAKVDDPLAIHESLNGSYTPAEFNSKVGSPSTASPSRYSALFKEQSGSNFGHVGSPLRPSPMHLGSSPGVRAGSRASSSELAFQISSPPRKSNMSALSQQLQQTRLSGEKQSPQTQNSAGLHPIARRHVSNPRTTYDRAVSSSSVNTNRIEEEQTDFVFSLDEEDYSSSPKPSPWASKPITLGSIGDGRIGSLNGENGKSRAVTMPPRK